VGPLIASAEISAPASRAAALVSAGNSAFGAYLPDAHAAISRAYALIVVTLERDRVSAMTWFGDLGPSPTSSSHESSPARNYT
jgi:hypothetical protein